MTCLTHETTQLHITETGDGLPVILLHGSASTGKQWRSLTAHLANRFTVSTPDLPGYGRSATPVNRRTLKETARELGSYIQGFGRPVHVVGHSFGGAVALKLAALQPELTRSLTLIEPAAFSAFWTAHGYDAPQTHDLRAVATRCHELAATAQPDKAMESFIDFWNGCGAWARTSAGLRAKVVHMLPQVLADFDAMSIDVMTNNDLAGIVCPVRILRGSASPRVMNALCGHLLRQLPFVRETVIPGAGHMLPMTDPHIVDPYIAEFMMKVDRGWQSCLNTRRWAA